MEKAIGFGEITYATHIQMPKDRVDNMSDRTYTKGVLKVEIVFYKFADGTCPVKDFIRSLDVKMKAKTLKTIELLENSGTALREPYSKSLGNGVFDLRIKQGSDITRVLYFFYVGNKAVLTNGFTKKTNKTPREQIELCQKYKSDYEWRKSNDGI